MTEPMSFHHTQSPITSTNYTHTLSADGGGVMVTAQVRRLTPLECERLMGWPDDYTRWCADGTEQADSHRYRQCGNGVAAPVAAWIGRHILTATTQGETP